jgi:uncharacterized protein YlzI (FlbEa/FlbD family)
MSKKIKGNFEATTVELLWNGKAYRVHKSVADAIKKRKDYSESEPKKKVKTVKKTK